MKQVAHIAKLLCLALAFAAMTAMCGCSLYSHSHMYKIAVKAVKEHPDFPKNAGILPIGEAKFFVGKSAACVLVPYSRDGAAGTAGDTYTVWLKRIAIRWETDRCHPTPKGGETAAAVEE